MDPVIEQAIRRECESELTKADLEQVTSLYLDDEVDGEVWDIEDINLEDLAKLPKLTELGLHPKITDAGLKELAKLKKLTELGLSNTKTTGAGFKDAKLKQLTSLHLDNTKVTDTGLKEVAKLQQLKELHLRETKSPAQASRMPCSNSSPHFTWAIPK